MENIKHKYILRNISGLGDDLNMCHRKNITIFDNLDNLNQSWPRSLSISRVIYWIRLCPYDIS